VLGCPAKEKDFFLKYLNFVKPSGEQHFEKLYVEFYSKLDAINQILPATYKD
jgi:hypothetical protein